MKQFKTVLCAAIIACFGLILSGCNFGNYNGNPGGQQTEEPAVLTSVSIGSGVINLEVGETSKLTIVTDPANYNKNSAAWSIVNGSSYIRLDQTGKVTAVAFGQATIKVTLSGKTATRSISVTDTVGEAESFINFLTFKALEMFIFGFEIDNINYKDVKTAISMWNNLSPKAKIEAAQMLLMEVDTIEELFFGEGGSGGLNIGVVNFEDALKEAADWLDKYFIEGTEVDLTLIEELSDITIENIDEIKAGLKAFADLSGLSEELLLEQILNFDLDSYNTLIAAFEFITENSEVFALTVNSVTVENYAAVLNALTEIEKLDGGVLAELINQNQLLNDLLNRILELDIAWYMESGVLDLTAETVRIIDKVDIENAIADFDSLLSDSKLGLEADGFTKAFFENLLTEIQELEAAVNAFKENTQNKVVLDLTVDTLNLETFKNKINMIKLRYEQQEERLKQALSDSGITAEFFQELLDKIAEIEAA